MSGRKYDWFALETKFLSFAGNLEAFAKQEGIPFVTVKNASARLGWIEKRDKYREKAAFLAQDAMARQAADKVVAQNERDIAAASALYEKALAFLPMCEKAADIKALSGALKDAQAMARLALGVSTENSNVNMTDDFEGWLRERVVKG